MSSRSSGTGSPPSRAGLSRGQLAVWASLLEASARKPGNVHPEAAFRDTSYVDFVLSATAIGPVFERAHRRSVGTTILRAVQATRETIGKNTNLGIVLLLAPLARATSPSTGHDEPSCRTGRGRRALRRELDAQLRSLTRRDADHVYQAIRLAAPGGLGSAPQGDVHHGPTGTLYEMMCLAAPRDLVARQYANAYREVVDEGLPQLQRDLRSGLTLEQSIVRCFLRLLATHGDTLIARKAGGRASEDAARRAASVLDAGWPQQRGSASTWSRLDRWLRAKDGARNPGACADLTAAVLFLALQGGIIQPPFTFDSAHGKLPSSRH